MSKIDVWTKVRGRRPYETKTGYELYIKTKQERPGVWDCKQNARTLFEVREVEEGWEVDCELYTPDGRFIRSSIGLFPELDGQSGPPELKGLKLEGNSFANLKIGVHIKSDGSIAIGVRS